MCIRDSPGKLDSITTAEGLAQALGLASAEGDTVTLQGDVTLSKGLSLLLDANQTITLNLNGHTLRAEADMAYAAIALSGVGTLRLTGGALAGNAEALPLLFVAGGTLEVANVTIDNADGTAARLLSGRLYAPATQEGAQTRFSGQTAIFAQDVYKRQGRVRFQWHRHGASYGRCARAQHHCVPLRTGDLCRYGWGGSRFCQRAAGLQPQQRRGLHFR